MISDPLFDSLAARTISELLQAHEKLDTFRYGSPQFYDAEILRIQVDHAITARINKCYRWLVQFPPDVVIINEITLWLVWKELNRPAPSRCSCSCEPVS